MKAIRNWSVLLALVIIIISCSKNESKETSIYDGMDSKTKTRMQQYHRMGKSLYLTHCSNCHQADGKGLGELYPPLAGSDYLMKDPTDITCLIKNGISGEIVVNGITYNQPMPAQSNLTNIEIAEIITYVANSWGNKSGLHEVSKIEKAGRACL